MVSAVVLIFFLASGFGSTYPHPYNEQRQRLFRAVVRLYREGPVGPFGWDQRL